MHDAPCPAVHTAMIGGSFDPVHLGHLHLIHQLVVATDVQRVLLVPVSTNNFKQDFQPAPDADRIAMLCLAVQAYRKIYPDDRDVDIIIDACELDRGGISYTYDTVLDIYNRYPVEGLLDVVMGDDLLPKLYAWSRFDQLREIVRFVVFCRTGHAFHPVEGTNMVCIDNDVLEDSSTSIRKLAHEQRDISSLVPQEVGQYVTEHRLYRD